MLNKNIGDRQGKAVRSILGEIKIGDLAVAFLIEGLMDAVSEKKSQGCL